MDYNEIKKLMDDMGNSKLTAIDIEFPDGIKISMKKDLVEKVITENAVSTDNNIAIENKVVVEKECKEDEGTIIKSPMVGTFYIKPSPTSKPYVEVGDEIKKGDTLCIIEAMKLMNEIEAEFSGKITEILVKDGEVVEYGAPLFKIR